MPDCFACTAPCIGRENHDEHGATLGALRTRHVEQAQGAMRTHSRSLRDDVKRALME